MTRLVRVLGVGCTILLLAGVTIWNVAFRAPSVDMRALAAGLIAAESEAGQKLLAESPFIADYGSLSKNFESQSRRAFCGVASSVIVLNALRNRRPHLTQGTFFDDASNRVRSGLRVTLEGMSLRQLADLLRAHGVDATLFYAADTNIDAFRTIARDNLQTPADFVLVNYERAVLGQGETGHISPLAAYNAQADRFLILDVAAYKYPPVWVSTQALWNAMNTVDRASDRTRGFIVVREKMEEHDMKVDGRCHCGKITYDAIIDADKVGMCHCADCQMLTGSAYRVAVAAPRESFWLRTGTPKVYVKTADSGNKRAHSFCADCGAPVYSSAVGDDPPAYSLRVGCLTQRAQLRPTRQIWCDSALPWSTNLESIPALARQ